MEIVERSFCGGILMLENEISVYPMGDKAITVKFGDEISPEINNKVIAFSQFLAKQRELEIIEWVPTYTDITIYYNPRLESYDQMSEKLQNWLKEELFHQQEEQRRIFLPVLYGGEPGPDIEYVADYHGIDREEVIRIHSSMDYRVYMLGFAPGFPYLGVCPRFYTHLD